MGVLFLYKDECCGTPWVYFYKMIITVTAPNSTQTCFLQTLNVLKKIFLIDVLKIEAQVL